MATSTSAETSPSTTKVFTPAEPEHPSGPSTPPSTTSGLSVAGLVRNLTSEVRTFLRQEIQLAKTELSEKVSRLGKNAVALAIGGAIAYAGLIVLLIGLGWLLAWAYSLAGLSPLFAAFLGLLTIGLISAGIGGVFVLKGISTMSKESLAPQRTMQTLQELKSGQAVSLKKPQEKASSAEMQARVEATENQMGETLDELGYRLSPQHINAQVKQRIQSKPYQAGLIAMAAGVLSGFLVRRRFRHA